MRKKHIITSTDATKARKYMSEITDKKIYRRLEVIALKGEGKKNIEIEDITKFSRQHITKLIRDFSTEGFTPLLSDGRRGNRRSVTVEDEKAFLNKYKTLAESGQVITVKEMWLDFCKTYNSNIRRTSFYGLLHRHNWRKIMPRSIHPKVADAEEIVASKKLKQATTTQ